MCIRVHDCHLEDGYGCLYVRGYRTIPQRMGHSGDCIPEEKFPRQVWDSRSPFPSMMHEYPNNRMFDQLCLCVIRVAIVQLFLGYRCVRIVDSYWWGPEEERAKCHRFSFIRKPTKASASQGLACILWINIAMPQMQKYGPRLAKRSSHWCLN